MPKMPNGHFVLAQNCAQMPNWIFSNLKNISEICPNAQNAQWAFCFSPKSCQNAQMPNSNLSCFKLQPPCPMYLINCHRPAPLQSRNSSSTLRTALAALHRHAAPPFFWTMPESRHSFSVEGFPNTVLIKGR